MSPQPPPLPTLGVIAQAAGVSLHRVRYLIDSRGITPTGRAGNAREFSAADVDRILRELQLMDLHRGGGHG
jgi:DNA-binding transcriptional MerR regulator